MTEKTIQGYLWVDYEDTALYPTKDSVDNGHFHSPGVIGLNSFLDKFQGEKVSITITVLEDE